MHHHLQCSITCSAPSHTTHYLCSFSFFLFAHHSSRAAPLPSSYEGLICVLFLFFPIHTQHTICVLFLLFIHTIQLQSSPLTVELRRPYLRSFSFLSIHTPRTICVLFPSFYSHTTALEQPSYCRATRALSVFFFFSIYSHTTHYLRSFSFFLFTHHSPRAAPLPSNYEGLICVLFLFFPIHTQHTICVLFLLFIHTIQLQSIPLTVELRRPYLRSFVFFYSHTTAPEQPPYR